MSTGHKSPKKMIRMHLLGLWSAKKAANTKQQQHIQQSRSAPRAVMYLCDFLRWRLLCWTKSNEQEKQTLHYIAAYNDCLYHTTRALLIMWEDVSSPNSPKKLSAIKCWNCLGAWNRRRDFVTKQAQCLWNACKCICFLETMMICRRALVLCEAAFRYLQKLLVLPKAQAFSFPHFEETI